MARSHMKRISAPRTWPILRKTNTFVRRPLPGAQSFEHGMSLQTWLIEVLGIATTAREAREAIRAGAVKVNGTLAKSQDQIVGLFDVISVEGSGDHLITLTAQNRLVARETKYTGENLSRIAGKGVVKGGVIQYRLMNGRNMRSDETYTVGQTVVVKDGSIDRVLPLENGAKVYVTRGASVGRYGTVKEITDEHIVVTLGDRDVATHKDVLIVVSGFAPLEGEN